MKIAVASGKGGTGKTLVATNLASVITSGCVYVDCDVEEPNGHLFLNPHIIKTEDVILPMPSIDNNKCTHCGHCAEVCQFHALIVAKDKVLVFPAMCHGCGSCIYFCPEKAITEVPRKIGKIKAGTLINGNMLTGYLNIGEPMAPPIIKELHRKIIDDPRVTIYDSPPGTSCPMISTVRTVDYVVLVTEPTPFGLHDLELAEKVVKKLNIPFGIVVNKSMPNNDLIKDHCRKNNIRILLEIPYDDDIARAYSHGELLSNEKKYTDMFCALYTEILKGAGS